MYKLYIVRIFDPPLSVSSKFTYKIFVLTYTFSLKLEKSIVFHSPNQIWLRCYSATVSAIRSISPIYNKGTLFYGRACCCVLICPKERVSSSRLVATSTYILYLIANYRYTDNHGHLRTLLDKFSPKLQ